MVAVILAAVLGFMAGAMWDTFIDRRDKRR